MALCQGNIYIPKSKTNIKDFRPIALLNVEGKLLFSLISKRLEAHLIANNGFKIPLSKKVAWKRSQVAGNTCLHLKKLIRTSQTLLQFDLISPMPMDLYHTN